MDVNIEHLADCPNAVPILAEWLFDEWGYRSADGTVQGIIETLNRRLNRDRLPMALVAIEQGRPLGTASLRFREVAIRPHYEHWLGTIYVHRPFREKGVGSMLINAAIREAAKLGIDDLYLYTRRTETENWYAKLGWVALERPTYRGSPAVIMRRNVDV